MLEDYKLTIERLKIVAGSLKYCDNPKLKKLGYKRINFVKHKYFIIYTVNGDTAIIHNIFNELQDYSNKIH